MTIESLKKEFWKKYTQLYNDNPEACELMRVIGVEQGKIQEQERIIQIIKADTNDEWLIRKIRSGEQ